jgi:hypothetical protein
MQALKLRYGDEHGLVGAFSWERGGRVQHEVVVLTAVTISMVPCKILVASATKLTVK